jgi:hypothetical protein
MLWKKAWLETRWRFLIGLAVLACSAAVTSLIYPQIVALMPLAESKPLPGGEIGRAAREAMELVRQFRGFVWQQYFHQNAIQIWVLFAAILGSGGIVGKGSGGAALFTLSLPVSRERLLGVRAATGLAELLILGVAPGLVISLLAPLVGQSYALADVLVHGGCLFLGGAVFYCLATYLSTVFADVWRPLTITLVVAIVLGMGELLTAAPHGVFHGMSGESWFRHGGLPWASLLVSLALSAGLVLAAARNFAQRDF